MKPKMKNEEPTREVYESIASIERNEKSGMPYCIKESL